MSLVSWWRRFDASRWVHRFLVLQAVALAWTTASALYLGLYSGRFALAVAAALLPGVATALCAWFAAAWSRERAWTWWAVFVFQIAGLLALASSVASGGLAAGEVGRLLLEAGGLVLVLHPDSRARLDRQAAASRPPSWRARL